MTKQLYVARYVNSYAGTKEYEKLDDNPQNAYPIYIKLDKEVCVYAILLASRRYLGSYRFMSR